MKNVILYLTFIGIAMTPIKTLAQDNTLTNQEKNEGWKLSRQRVGKLSAMI